MFLRGTLIAKFVLGEDERIESIHHQFDVWHKSIKLTKELNEVEIISYVLNLLITI